MNYSKELMNTLNELEKESNLELAIKVMQLTIENIILQKNWNELYKHIEKEKDRTSYDGDAYRWTIYDNLLKYMIELKENE